MLDIEARPFGKGFWGKRVKQTDLRVDAFELKINPHNESFYVLHPDGGFVRFENILTGALQDGKLIMKPKSFYHVYDLPGFARNKVLEEARRQVAAAQNAGFRVEWLVSEPNAVTQLKRFFKESNIKIDVVYYPE